MSWRDQDLDRLMAASMATDREIERQLAAHRERVPDITPDHDAIPVMRLGLAPVVPITAATGRRRKTRHGSRVPFGPLGGAA